jgi:hypothetical protein
VPVPPEPPDSANGLLTELDDALPVLPLLVALACELAAPELPDVAEGLEVTDAVPPMPPFELPTETLEPPTTELVTAGASTRLTAGAAGPANVKVRPPDAPSPPMPNAATPLAARPVGPDAESDAASAPEPATLSALPMATAGPVFPELPEFPDLASPPTAIAVPRMPVLVAVGLEVAAPVEPVDPELPETATGFDTAFDVALPVRPVLVALDWELVPPELPVEAVGFTETVDPPPLPPLALPTATLDPPVAVAAAVGAATTFTAAPPRPDAERDAPPLPPLPPTDTASTLLVALPVEPDLDVEEAPAPVLAELLAEPIAVAAPVLPELPEFPVMASALAPDAPRRSINAAAADAAIVARTTRTNVRNFVVLILLSHLPSQSGATPDLRVNPGMKGNEEEAEARQHRRAPVPSPPSQRTNPGGSYLRTESYGVSSLIQTRNTGPRCPPTGTPRRTTGSPTPRPDGGAPCSNASRCGATRPCSTPAAGPDG